MTKINLKGLRQKLGLKPKKRGYLRSLLSGLLTKTLHTHGVKSEAPTANGSELSNTVQRLKDLPLRDFITCSVDGNLSVLGNGSPEQLQAIWIALLSEYYQIKGDKRALKYVQIVSEMEMIRNRGVFIGLLLDSLSMCYDEQIAACLREEFKQFKFTEDSYKVEIKHVVNIEKKHLLRFQVLKSEFDNLEGKKTETTASKDRQRLDYIELILDINKNEGSQYTEAMSTETFALCVKRLEAQYEILKRQSDSSKK